MDAPIQRPIQLGHVNYPGLLTIADLNPQVAIELSQRQRALPPLPKCPFATTSITLPRLNSFRPLGL